MVEVPEGHGEGEKRDEVEVPKRKRPAKVQEPEQEHEAKRKPVAEAVDLLAAECALVSAGHLPRDLRAGPRFGDAGRAVVHLPGGDHACVDLVVLLPRDGDVPAAARPTGGTLRGVGLVGRVGDPSVVGIAVEPVRNLVVPEEECCSTFLGQPGLGSTRSGGNQDRRRQHGHGCEQVQPQCRLRNDQSLLPTKFAGVTVMIAIACATIFPTPSLTNRVRMARLPT